MEGEREMGKFEIQKLTRGDLVEFPENKVESRYGIVTSGFGMSPECIGSKIFGVFGQSVEEVKSNWILYLERQKIANKDFEKYMNMRSFHFQGFTRRQKCRVIENVIEGVNTGKEC